MKPLLFKGLNVSLPIIIPIKGRGVIDLISPKSLTLNSSFHDDTWEKWTDPHTCQVSWFHSVCAWVEGSEHYHFKWLDDEHGWLQISFWGSCEEAVHSLLRWRGMFSDHLGFALQFLLPARIEGVLQDMQNWKAAAAAINPKVVIRFCFWSTLGRVISARY